MVSINDMPLEILEMICSWVVESEFDAHPWKHRLATRSIAGIVLSEKYQRKRLLSVIKLCPILYQLLRTPSALICGHNHAPETPLDVLRRTNMNIAAGNHVKRCYIGVDFVDSTKRGPDDRVLEMTQEGVEQVRRAAHFAEVTLPHFDKAERHIFVLEALILARHPNITELGLDGDPRDLVQICDLNRSDGRHLLPSLKSIFVRPTMSSRRSGDLPILETSHLSKLLNLGAKVSDIFIEDFNIRLTDVLATQHLSAITLNRVIARADDLRRLLRNAQGLRSFAMDSGTSGLFAPYVVAMLAEHCPALETLCLNLDGGRGPSGSPPCMGEADPMSLRKFNNLRNIWIDNWSITRSIQERPGPVVRPLSTHPRDWTSSWNEFMSTLPESVERIHFGGSVHTAINRDVWCLIPDFQALAADHRSGRYPKLREVALESRPHIELVRKALKDAGLKVLSEAEKKPFQWL